MLSNSKTQAVKAGANKAGALQLHAHLEVCYAWMLLGKSLQHLLHVLAWRTPAGPEEQHSLQNTITSISYLVRSLLSNSSREPDASNQMLLLARHLAA
jgi:hypothetical protein